MSVKQIEIDKGWNKILREHRLKKINIKIGLWGESNDPRNNLAYRGLIHQNPSPNSNNPRRPFMSNAMDKNEADIKNFTKNEYKKVVDGKQSLKKMANRIGAKHEGQIKKSFTEFNYVPNKPATILRKGSSTPLIDKAIMRGSVKYKVETK